MRDIIRHLVFSFMIIMNIIGFTSMGIDKSKAKKNLWRTPEKILILIAFAGGSVGSFLGMKFFRHKTKHLKFVILIPLALLFNLLVFVYFIQKL